MMATGIALLHDEAVLLTGEPCLLYTSDAADERSSVDLGGRRIIKKKKTVVMVCDRVSVANILYIS